MMEKQMPGVLAFAKAGNPAAQEIIASLPADTRQNLDHAVLNGSRALLVLEIDPANLESAVYLAITDGDGGIHRVATMTFSAQQLN